MHVQNFIKIHPFVLKTLRKNTFLHQSRAITLLFINKYSPFAIPNHSSQISMSMQSLKTIGQKLLKSPETKRWRMGGQADVPTKGTFWLAPHSLGCEVQISTHNVVLNILTFVGCTLQKLPNCPFKKVLHALDSELSDEYKWALLGIFQTQKIWGVYQLCPKRGVSVGAIHCQSKVGHMDLSKFGQNGANILCGCTPLFKTVNFSLFAFI